MFLLESFVSHVEKHAQKPNPDFTWKHFTMAPVSEGNLNLHIYFVLKFKG